MDISRKRATIVAALVWTCVVAALYFWHHLEHDEQIVSACRTQAVRSYEKDILFRRWASMHGGVYVPSTAETPPNPYLKHLPERDIRTPSNKLLTLVNPAYMTRQMFDLEKSVEGGLAGHLSSLEPVNAVNAPDAWEAAALATFANGKSEVSEVVRLDGTQVYRLIRPLYAEKGCLQQCHRGKGYRIGDVMGGLSVAVPMGPVIASFKKIHFVSAVTYGAIWIGSVFLIVYAVRKNAEATRALKASEEMFSNSFKNAPLLMTLGEIEDGRYIAVNDKFTEISGFGRDETLGRTAAEIGWTSIEGAGKISALLKEQGRFSGIELAMRSKDGRAVFCSYSGELVDVAGEKRILLIAEDVTGRNKAQEELHRHREQLQIVIERMPDACIFWDPAFKVVFWNPAAERIFGFGFAEAAGKHAFDLIISEQTQERVREIWERIVSGDSTTRTEIKNVTKNGKLITCEWHNAPVKDQTGAIIGVISMAQDVSGRRLLDEQLRQAQKFEAIGTLAGGVAHDFNNILTAISGYGHLVLMNTPPDDPRANDVKQIINATKRASQLTQGLLTFSRKQPMNMQVLDLNDAVRSFDGFIRRILGADIDLTTGTSGMPLPVMADRSQLEQVFMNLMTNARDAMPDGGKISISAGMDAIDSDFIRTKGYGVEGAYALLTVTDTGIGMDEVSKKRIFEPFYTTKEVGKGTGLGLAVVYGIVKQHGGFIDIESAPGAGTTVMIHLPLQAGAGEASSLSEEERFPRGNETILVAEDEGMVRDIVRKLLERFGYRVIEAGNGEEGLQLFQKHRERIALVLTDVMMPRKNGLQLYKELRTIDPGIKTIFMSGYMADLTVLQELREAGLSFIQKPIAPAELLSIIRRELAARPHS